MYRYILFDLDGTLTDPGEGITKSIRYAFESFGLGSPALKELEVYIGPPLEAEFVTRLGVTEEFAKALTEKFRERYNEVGWCENHPVDGMCEALARLKDAGCLLAVATSKPLPVARRVLDHFDMSKYFDAICGSRPDGSASDKAGIVAEALGALGVTEDTKREAIMVGDRIHDVAGGRANGLATLCVAMGYGNAEEFQAPGVVYVADSAREMADFLLAE